MAELLNRIAFDEDKNIVFVENAVKGKNYFCPECNGRFVYKNSGKTGPGTKRPHFAHQSDVSNCSPETILHASFKIKAAELLSERIAKGENFPIEWTCLQCNVKYPYNILFMAKHVKVEHDLKECRPDIALLDADGNAIAVIEVVVTHAPEENTLKYYHDNGIVLVQYNVKETDLLDIAEKLKHPDVVSLCLTENCMKNNASITKRVIYPQKMKCEHCQQEYDVYGVLIKTPLGEFIPRDLNGADVQNISKLNPNVIMKLQAEYCGIKTHVLRTRCACFRQRLQVRIPVRVAPAINFGGYADRSVRKSNNYNRKRSFYNKKRW